LVVTRSNANHNTIWWLIDTIYCTWLVTDNDLRLAANWVLPRRCLARWQHVSGRIGSFHDTLYCGCSSLRSYWLNRPAVVLSFGFGQRNDEQQTRKQRTVNSVNANATDCKREDGAPTNQDLQLCWAVWVVGTYFEWIGFYFFPVISQNKKKNQQL